MQKTTKTTKTARPPSASRPPAVPRVKPAAAATAPAERVPQAAALHVLMAGVKQRRRVAIRYRDQERSRVVEPHVIYTDENREVVADCYQVRGYSAGGRPTPFWRPFRIKKIVEAALLNEPFAPRFHEGFNPEKVKYRAGMVAMVGETNTAFVFNEAPEPMGPFLPKRSRR